MTTDIRNSRMELSYNNFIYKLMVIHIYILKANVLTDWLINIQSKHLDLEIRVVNSFYKKRTTHCTYSKRWFNGIKHVFKYVSQLLMTFMSSLFGMLILRSPIWIYTFSCSLGLIYLVHLSYQDFLNQLVVFSEHDTIKLFVD